MRSVSMIELMLPSIVLPDIILKGISNECNEISMISSTYFSHSLEMQQTLSMFINKNRNTCNISQYIRFSNYKTNKFVFS